MKGEGFRFEGVGFRAESVGLRDGSGSGFRVEGLGPCGGRRTWGCPPRGPGSSSRTPHL